MSASHHHLIQSLNPQQSSVVFSSAGSGKTWLLIARILRLLLHQADPDSILAITFTRKAAGEMRTRLNNKIQQWAFASDAELHSELETIGISNPTPAILDLAHNLYERVVLSDKPVYITTFHAFCHDIQKTFPLESSLPIGFSLTEFTQPIFEEALQTLYAQAEKDTDLYNSLDTLFRFCDGPSGTRIALKNFWQTRSEWLLFTDSNDYHTGHHASPLQSWYDCRTTTTPCSREEFSQMLHEYLYLLKESDTATHQRATTSIDNFLSQQSTDEFALRAHFLYANRLEVKSLRLNKKLQSILGNGKTDRLHNLHHTIGQYLIESREQSLREQIIHANEAWRRIGERLLEIYQQLKIQRGLADFDDLEFETFRLMRSKDHASWLQFKLGSRLAHILVDEFQDTNYFQWGLLQPIIQATTELAETSGSSIFLVGDVKQSIYRFRRANPAIMQAALKWCKPYFHCEEYKNDYSWRSGPAIVDFVNRVFQAAPFADKLPGFSRHQCQQPQLWSRVEIHPLFENTPATEPGPMRNPLQQPRQPFSHSSHYQEGLFIAERIHRLVSQGLMINHNNRQSPVQFGDILILTRNRTHLQEYERALRDRQIPFASNESGYWLQRLEIRDLRALLSVLDNPFDDLNLAHVLRSPLFCITNEVLLQVCDSPGQSLFERIGVTELIPASVRTAYQRISRWSELCNRIPIHDLLDTIYFEWGVTDRYQKTARSGEQLLVEHYLDQFLALALQLDSGRYPNVQRFLAALDQLENELVDTFQDSHNQVVRLLTIHGAKGLEAPVVILADSGPNIRPPKRLPVLMDWPAKQNQPSLIVLTKNDEHLDRQLQALKHTTNQAVNDEDYNLIYVAITRARQLLIVTGSANSRGTSSWHNQLSTAIDTPELPAEGWSYEAGIPEYASHAAANTLDTPQIPVPDALAHPSLPTNRRSMREKNEDNESTRSGIFLHKCLEVLSEKPDTTTQEIINRLQTELRAPIASAHAEMLYAEAKNCMESPACREIFSIQKDELAHNELSILDYDANGPLLSVIDRLIVRHDYIWIVDYKSNEICENFTIDHLIARYQSQMSRYKNTVAKIFPDRPIRCSILLTKRQQVIDI